MPKSSASAFVLPASWIAVSVFIDKCNMAYILFVLGKVPRKKTVFFCFESILPYKLAYNLTMPHKFTRGLFKEATMNRKFGVEIEAYNVNKTELAAAINAAGILCAVEGYNHDTRGHWKIVSDGSLQGYNTFELVSPILEGDNGLMQVEVVCQVLKLLNAKINTSCGLHVHIDARDIDVNGLKRVSKMWMKYESCFDEIVTPSRRNSRWAAGLRCKFQNLDAAFAAIDAAQNRAGVAYAMNSDGFSTSRYHKLNLESLQRHGTIEFRQHQGTIDATKITNWVTLVGGFVNTAIAAKTIRKAGDGKFENLLDVLPTAKAKTFFKERRAKFAVAV